MAEKIKRVKASTIPTATSIEGFNAIGIKVNTDGTVDNVKVPMDLLEGNKGDKGDKGDPFIYSDFTPEQLALLVGEKGDKGDIGAKGDKGDKGDKGEKGDPNSLAIGAVQKGEMAGASITGTAPNQTLNLVLPKGDKGDTGEKGEQGLKGDTGDVGKSAYQVWLDAGNTGTISVYLDSLKGEKGDKGDKGDIGAKGDKGDKGDPGIGDMLKSEYDSDGNGIVDNAEKVGGFTVGTNVPANAKFTDTTYEEITEAEINTGTASTLRTITARRVTFILSKVSTLINNAIGALTKSSVGLNNVDNVKQIPFSEKGANNGVAELDSTGKVLSSQLPSYVDDVLEYATSTNFPTTGETGKIYIAINTNLTYRWTGTAYTEISPSIALGETSATAYRGDRGKTAYDHSQTAHAPSTAQKNSDITKAEIEAKLTGAITSHTHNQYIESSKFQVVESLPASPVSGTFYFVKE